MICYKLILFKIDYNCKTNFTCISLINRRDSCVELKINTTFRCENISHIVEF